MRTYWDSSALNDLMHAEAAVKYGADELLTLDDAGFASLNLSLQVAAS